MSSFLIPLILGLGLGVLIGWLVANLLGVTRRQAAQDELVDASLHSSNNTNAAHLDVIRQLAPIGAAMDQLSTQVRELERNQAATQSTLVSQVQAMTRTSHRLSDRTDKLVSALRSPNVRGRWGEIQLERVVELGGMMRHCDFEVQVNARLGNVTVRPDMVIRLAGGKSVVVDAKVPFTAYLDAMETEDPEEQAGFMRRHAHHLRQHVTQLSAKPYVEAFSPTPEFVVAFVPADPFLDAALSVDADILDYALSRNVVIATPSTLFALLRTVALGWKHEDVNERTQEIQRLGRELHQRLKTFGEHYSKIGSSLEKAVDAFNASVGSLDSRVMVTARRLEEIDVVSTQRSASSTADSVQTRPRPIPAELQENGDESLFDPKDSDHWRSY